ncbi:hypothetical protein D3C78_1603380 [compost metagenome]
MHGSVQAGVLATCAALGRHLVVEFVLDLHLARFADLAEVQSDDQLPGLAVVNNPGGYFGKGVANLVGECATVQFFEELCGIGRGGHGFFSGVATRPLGGRLSCDWLRRWRTNFLIGFNGLRRSRRTGTT